MVNHNTHLLIPTHAPQKEDPELSGVPPKVFKQTRHPCRRFSHSRAQNKGTQKTEEAFKDILACRDTIALDHTAHREETGKFFILRNVYTSNMAQCPSCFAQEKSHIRMENSNPRLCRNGWGGIGDEGLASQWQDVASLWVPPIPGHPGKNMLYFSTRERKESQRHTIGQRLFFSPGNIFLTREASTKMSLSPILTQHKWWQSWTFPPPAPWEEPVGSTPSQDLRAWTLDILISMFKSGIHCFLAVTSG